MASPFAIFRRNQQTLLVVLFILAIFAFTLSDLLTSNNVNLPMLGLIIGTCILTVVGVKLKQTAKFAAIGAVAGLAIGFGLSLFVNPTAPDTVAKSKLGAFSETEVQRMLRDRGAANQFLQAATQRAFENPQEAMNQARNYLFGITGMGDEEEAVLCYLMLEEAKRLGISIDKNSVSEFISLVTDNKLSKTAYDEILHSTGLTDSQLYLILQEQITIRTVQQQLAPSGFMTPEQYWEMYKKMRVSQKIQSVAIPVETLAESIKAPKNDSELQSYFEEHKQNFPGDPDPESVGFRQPRKIQIAYVEASYLDLETTVGEITDNEIEEFYEENKDILYLNRQVPDDPLGGNPFNIDSLGPDLSGPSLEGPNLDLDSLIPKTTPGTDGSKPEAESPGDPEGSDKPEPKQSDSPEEPGDAPENPESPQSPEPGKSQDPPSPESQSLIDRADTALQTVAFVQEEKETEPEKNNPTVEQPAGNETTEPAAETEGESTDPKTIPPAPETDLEAPLKAPKPWDEPERPKYKPLDNFLRDEIRDMLLRQKTNELQQKLATEVLDAMSKLSDKYFALQDDESVRAFAEDETVQAFVAQRTKELNEQKKQGDIDEPTWKQRTEELNFKKLNVNKAKNLFALYAQDQLQKLAKAKGLTYSQTPLLNGRDLTLSSEHPIGSASLGMELSNASQETVARYAFNLPADGVYDANAARSLDPDSIYVFWKTADRDEHIPTWDEPGIKDQVLEAWRLEQARPKAEARATALADRLRDVKETWSELLLQETVTGDKDGVLLHPLISDTFTWISTSSTPSPFGFPMEVPELTELKTVEKAGPDFMETIFNKMKSGEIGVVPNHDRSIYYVVQIRDRRPATEEEFEVQRELFLRANLFPMNLMQFEFPTPYSILVNSEGGELYRTWLEDLKKKYDVKMIERKEGRT